MERALTALRRVASALLSLVLVGCLLLFALLALGPHVFGYRTATMLTGSMEPGISPGDVVASVPRPATASVPCAPPGSRTTCSGPRSPSAWCSG